MQNIIIFALIYLWTATLQCQINNNAVDYIYPSLNSPFIFNIEDLTFDQNLIFQLQEQINSTYYYSSMNAPQPLELNGTIISSDQQMFGNLIFFGNLAILVQNQSGYYPYLITTNKQEYLIELVGNPIPSLIQPSETNQIIYKNKSQNSILSVIIKSITISLSTICNFNDCSSRFIYLTSREDF